MVVNLYEMLTAYFRGKTSVNIEMFNFNYCDYQIALRQSFALGGYAANFDHELCVT